MTRYAHERKCAKVRTKKRKVTKSYTKKERGRFRKSRESSSKKGISLHDTRMRGKVQKCTEMHTKKKKAEMQRKAEQKKSLLTRYRRRSIKTFRIP